MVREFLIQKSKNKLKKWSVKEILPTPEPNNDVLEEKKEEPLEEKEEKPEKKKRGRKPTKDKPAKVKYGKVIYFGQTGYRDFTLMSANPEIKEGEPNHIKEIYLKRHKAEDWSDLSKAGCWARYILWNLPTMEESARDMEDRFNIKITIDKTPIIHSSEKAEKKEE